MLLLEIYLHPCITQLTNMAIKVPMPDIIHEYILKKY